MAAAFLFPSAPGIPCSMARSPVRVIDYIFIFRIHVGRTDDFFGICNRQAVYTVQTYIVTQTVESTRSKGQRLKVERAFFT
jgi:hypothetical protein